MRQTDDRPPPPVVITEAAPAALAGVNTGRSPSPIVNCRSGSVTEPRRQNDRPVYFFAQAAKASANALSPDGPFSIARMARPPLA